MNEDATGAYIIIAVTSVILLGHLLASILIWRSLSVRVSLLVLIFLSLTTYLILYVFAAAVGTYLALSINELNTPADRVYHSSLELFLFPCELRPQSWRALEPALCDSLTFIIWPPILYAVGSLTAVFVRRKAGQGD